jgi:hypothetical protein
VVRSWRKRVWHHTWQNIVKVKSLRSKSSSYLSIGLTIGCL